MLATSGRDRSERDIAMKLHRQFCHPSSEKLIKLVRNSRIKNKRKIEKEIRSITDQCITCIKFRRRTPRPVVCLPMATTFNEAVAMDLKKWGNKHFLVMVDMATRFCTASVINDKMPATIIKSFLVSWITLFGAPKKILTDNGGEFNNREMITFSQIFNFKIKTTAAESPWSNGIVERMNGVLGKLVNKIMEDTKCDAQMALAWAVAARNALDNKAGFSPNQLVFGFNPAIPDLYSSDLPGLQDISSSEIVRKNLNAVHKARDDFIKSQSDERVKQALRRNVNITDLNLLKDGDEVFYKRNARDEWNGPGKVIDIDGKTVIVKHGGACIKVHEVSLKKKPQVNNVNDVDSITPSGSDYSAISDNNQGLEASGNARSSASNSILEPRIWEETDGISSSDKPYSNSSGFYPVEYDTTIGGQGPRVSSSVGGDLKNCSQSESAMASRGLGYKEISGTSSLDKNTNNPVTGNLNRSTMTSRSQSPRVNGSVVEAYNQFKSTTVENFESLEETSNAGSSSKNDNSNSKSFPGRSQDSCESTIKIHPTVSEGMENPGASSSMEVELHKRRNRKSKSESKNRSRVWKSGERFQGIDSDSGEYISGKIMYRAGKATAANRDFYNIERDDNGWQGCINMNKIRDLSAVPDETEMIILLNNGDVFLAKETEIQNWLDNNVFEEVPDNNQKAISVRWVVTEKIVNGKRIIKARLVARGFEEDTSSLRKESPTCSRESIRILILIASSRNWDCHTVDVKAAYLQGSEIERTIFLRPPPEFNNGFLWKLKKTVYGLCDTARAWYLRVKDELSSLSVKMCDLDNSLFLWYNKGKLDGIICIYVDDFLWSGTPCFENQVINKLKEKFLIGSSASIAFIYVGLSIKSYDNGITIDQNQYIASLNPIPLSQSRLSQRKSLLNSLEKVAYRALVGQLNWVATHTRPDIAFDTCALSVAFKEATIGDLVKLNKLVTRVKSSEINLFFPRLHNLENCTIECYADAAFKNLPSKGSQGGILIFLKDEKGQKCPLIWQSKKQDRVADSTLTAETLALLEGAKISIYLAAILKQILRIENLKIFCFSDNKSLTDSLTSLKQVKDRSLRLETVVLGNMLDREDITQVSWISSPEQLADCLTKKGVCVDKLHTAISRV